MKMRIIDVPIDQVKVNKEDTWYGMFLERIYAMQIGLLDHYKAIEGLPDYPLDVNTKASQKLLKEFSRRVVEELSEAFDCYEQVIDFTMEPRNRYWLPNEYHNITPSKQYHEDFEKSQSLIINFNEELGDALHFMVELLIYSNIQPEDIQRYVLKHSPDYQEEHEDILQLAMNYGYHIIDSELNVEETGGYNEISILNLVIHKYEYQVKAGLVINPSRAKVDHSVILWNITCYLNKAMNLLKNREWKQSEEDTNVTQFQEKVVQAFLLLMGYYKYLGLDSEFTHRLYSLKNYINVQRIINKY